MAQTVYRCSFRSFGHGVEFVNTLHVVTDSDLFTDPDPTAQLAAAMAGDLKGAYKALLSVDDTLQDLTVAEEQDPAFPDALREGAVETINEAGTRALGDNDLPASLCGLVKLQTAVYGRAFHGRQFLPPIRTAADIDAGHIDTTRPYYTAMAAWAARLEDFNVQEGTWLGLDPAWTAKLVNYSRRRRIAAAPNYWADVEAVSVSPTLHYLRSRET